MPDAEAGELKFKDVTLVGKPGSGLFKATPAQFGWRTMEPGKSDSQAFNAGEIVSASWRQCLGGGRCRLKVCFKSGPGGASRFGGFRLEDMAALVRFFRENYKVDVVEHKAALEGSCWGDVTELPGAGDAQDPDLKVTINGKVGFDLAMDQLKQVNTLAKTDLQLEFQEPDPGSMLPGDEWLSEIRFMVPGGGGAGTLTAEDLKDVLQKRGGLSDAGEVLARVRDVTIVTPRGKHDFEFFPSAVKIHGKTQTYSIKYSDIRHFFMLDDIDQRQLVVVGLTQPLSQGQQAYHHLVLQWQGQTMQVPEELPEERLKSMQVKRGEMEQASKMMARLLRELTGQTVIGPSTKFPEMNARKEKFIRCTYKASPGMLFFNNKSLLYVTKPVLWLKYGDVAHVAFPRDAKMRGRTFDVEVHLRSGASHEFSQIDVDVKPAVYKFLKELAGLRIENEREVEASLEGRQRRAEGRASGARDAELPDDDTEADGDFEGGEESDGSPSSDQDADTDVDEPQAKRARK